MSKTSNSAGRETVIPKFKLRKESIKSVVRRLATGNVRLKKGRYVTKQELRERRDKALAVDI